MNTKLGHAIRRGGSLTALLCVLMSGLFAVGSEYMLTQERVRELFDYREDGSLIRVTTGKSVGSQSEYGYIRVMVDRVRTRRSRVVFLYHKGYLPEVIDHINGKRDDDRIENLRGASLSVNGFNRHKNPRNTSGKVGVHFHKQSNKWIAQVTKNKNTTHLGCFDDFNSAVEARLKGEEAIYGEQSPA